MNQDEYLSEEQVDFLREMMNIGTGNAATALSQILGCEVNMEIPTIRVFPSPEADSVLDDPSLRVSCVRMGMVGDVLGDLFFIVPEEHRMVVTDLAESTSGMRNEPGAESPHSEDLSVLNELGNIIAGVYLAAVHDFCKLNIYHTVPALAIDMVQSLLDESLSRTSSQIQAIIVIESRFVIEKRHRLRTFLLMIPLEHSLKVLVDSMEQARRLLAER